MGWTAGIGTRVVGLRALAAALTVAGALGCATPVQERPWLEARSEHFTLYSALPQDRTRALAVDLEIFRAAVGLFTDVESTASPIPIEIIVFADERDLRRFGAGREVGGFVQPTPRSYQIALAGSEDMSEQVVLYHEYVHFLVRNGGGRLLPRWYDEGFADFLSTAQRRDTGLLIGLPHPIRATWLVRGRQMPVAQLIEPGILAELDGNATGRFYARAWLLVHYLSWDYPDAERVGFSQRMQSYLAAIERGVEPVDALELAWDLGAEELDERLDQTVRTGVKIGSLPLEHLAYSDDVSVRSVAPEEMARRLGAVALMTQQTGFARALFEDASRANPSDARAIAGLADSYKFADEMEEALPLFDRAVELDPDDVLNLLDRAEYWLDRAAQSEDEAARGDFALRALEDIRRARRLAPQNPESLWACGAAQLLLAPPDPDEALWALERAHALLPGDRLILMSLLGAYASAGRAVDAQRVGQWLISQAHGKQEIEEVEAGIEAASRAASGGARPTAATGAASAAGSCRT